MLAYCKYICFGLGERYISTLVNFLSLLFISLHGLVRGDNMELGRDSDTGGQVIVRHVFMFLFFSGKNFISRREDIVMHGNF